MITRRAGEKAASEPQGGYPCLTRPTLMTAQLSRDEFSPCEMLTKLEIEIQELQNDSNPVFFAVDGKQSGISVY